MKEKQSPMRHNWKVQAIDLIYQKPCIPEYISDRFRLKFDVNLTLCDYVGVNININIIMNLVSFSFLELTHFEILSWS